MKKWLCFLIVLLVTVIDQLTKQWAFTHLIPYQPLPILPFLNFTLAFNTGAAFGFLSQSGPWHLLFFAGLSLIIISSLSVWLYRLPKEAFLQSLGLSLIIGGALGNFIDRLHFGFVVDFIDLYYKTHHFYIFNFADACISCGTVLYLFFWRRQSRA